MKIPLEYKQGRAGRASFDCIQGNVWFLPWIMCIRLFKFIEMISDWD